ncbi:MAG: zinc-ribbon domain-containing protein [Thermoplasmata archaeon]
MAARYCPQCGGANSPTAAFCQYCGTALPPAPSSPLPSSGPTGAPPPPPVWGAPPYDAAPYGAPPYSAPSPARPRRRLWLWILVGLVVFILIVGVIGYLALPYSPAINVTEITFQSSDNPCGIATPANASWEGFTANTSQIVWLLFSIGGNVTSGGGTASCTISTVSSATAGFSVSGADVPLSIPANTNEMLQFNVTCPGSAYNGVLNLSVT